MNNEKKLNKYLPVIIGKNLAQARFSMDLWERRLMYVCMSKLTRDDERFPIIQFTLSDIAKLLDEKSLSDTDYIAIKKASKKLVTRVVEIQEKSKYRVINWVSMFELDTKTNSMSMQFNEYMKPYLLDLLENKGYTKFLLKFGMALSSKYAQRFYEMFRGMVYLENPKVVQKIELQELRRRLELDDKKHTAYGHFKARVLDLAEKEINQKTDIYISFKEIRGYGKGRPIQAIYVSVVLKTEMIHEWDRFMLWQKDDLLERLYKIVERQGQKLDIAELEKYSHESLARLVYDMSNSINIQEIKNYQAFIEWKLKQWQTVVGIQQITLEDL
jgi:hypothetical protein